MLFSSLLIGSLLLGSAGSVTSETRNVAVGTRTITAHVVRAKTDQVRIKIGLGQGLMARSESLSAIAKRYKAVAAVNGCFFDAYTKDSVRNIDHLLVTNGRCEHKANRGPALGVTADGEVRIESTKWTIDGASNGNWKWPDRWYAEWINRKPTSARTVVLFTPLWGKETGYDGLQVVVENGKVKWITRYSATIPSGGYVILFKGADEEMGKKFAIGQEVDYRLTRTDSDDVSFWSRVQEALGCGPTLVAGGRVVVDPEAEGFTDAKITTQSSTRSAVGLTASREILFVAVSGTMAQLAAVMKGLGCVDAMALDGGASSGLWFRGKYLRTPGRPIANAILLLPKS